SGITVVDVDIKEWENKHGDQTLKALTEKYGALPTTRTQKTWSGGLQIVFAYTPGAPNSADCYGRHIDGRNDGGYIVAPPSRVVEGTREGVYRWIVDWPLAPMPAWLFALGTQRRKNGTGATVKTIAGSSRNVALTSAAGSMRRRDMSEEAVRAA